MWHGVAAISSLSSGFLTMADPNRTVQSQKMARDLKIRIYEVEGWYYPSSENKGADQLRSQVFSRRGSHWVRLGFYKRATVSS